MKEAFYFYLKKKFNLSNDVIKGVIRLYQEQWSVHYLARYRRSEIGGIDEEQIKEIFTAFQRIEKVESRKLVVIEAIKSKGLLNKHLEFSIQQASTLQDLEDLYTPYKKKTTSKFEKAIKLNLLGLARELRTSHFSPGRWHVYLNSSKGIHSIDLLKELVGEIHVQWIAEDMKLKSSLRKLFIHEALLISKVKKGKREEGIKFENYFDWEELFKRIPSYRLGAILRGKDKGVLAIKIKPVEEEALKIVERKWCPNNPKVMSYWKDVCKKVYRKRFYPSLEREMLQIAVQKRLEGSLPYFKKNLKDFFSLYSHGPISVLAIDPGLKNHSKWVALSSRGRVLSFGKLKVISSSLEKKSSLEELESSLEKYSIKVVLIGNGRGLYETLSLIKPSLELKCHIQIIDERGASVYSASSLAKKELPHLDILFKGAVSIGRRFQDSLSEMIKIEPIHLGAGQYQHDLDPRILNEKLNEIISQIIHERGVFLNTASCSLLEKVCGIRSSSARAIVEYRDKNGPFSSREELRKVPSFGERSFEEAAGFLIIENGPEELDRTEVHPKHYQWVHKLMQKKALNLKDLINHLELLEVSNDDERGIFLSLKKGMRRYRDLRASDFSGYPLGEKYDLKVGELVEGRVKNVTDFGVFIDIGWSLDGFIHKSLLAPKFFNQFFVEDIIESQVLDIDLKRKRLSLKPMNKEKI